MPSKQAILSIINDMKSHLKNDNDYDTFTMNGLTFQKMPANINKKGVETSPAKLSLVFNPVINGKTMSRKGKYFWEQKNFNIFIDSLVAIKENGTFFLKCMSRANPDRKTTASIKSDHTYEL